jgi:hypothetical protein
MPIQIDQTIPKCQRCGKLVHDRDPRRIEEDEALFCSEPCRAEHAALLNGEPPVASGSGREAPR